MSGMVSELLIVLRVTGIRAVTSRLGYLYLYNEVSVVRGDALEDQVSAVGTVYRHGNKDEDYGLLGRMPSLASIGQSGMGIMRRVNREGGLVVASSTRRYIVSTA